MTTEQDMLAIQELLNEWKTGWDTQDSALAARAYSEDAEWVNAFGVRIFLALSFPAPKPRPPRPTCG